MAQFGETFWFCKKGERVVTSFANRMIHGIFVGHHARTGAVLCIYKGIGRGKSWTRQPLNDAWDASHGKGSKPHHNQCRERTRTIRASETKKKTSSTRRCRRCACGTRKWGADVGSTCGRIWRGHEDTTRGENTERHPH